ncbi:MAG: hypothetical protein ACRDJC_22120 [Thermomicrobiales bacterium]
MTDERSELDIATRTQEFLRAGAEAEWRLLKQERKAEKRLAAAIAALAQDELRMQKAHQRLERSRAAVAEAEVDLRDAQERRATGSTSSQD